MKKIRLKKNRLKKKKNLNKIKYIISYIESSNNLDKLKKINEMVELEILD